MENLIMHDHVQSVEHLKDGRVRVVAVLPEFAFEQVIELLEYITHGAKYLSTRMRCSQSSRKKNYVVNRELVYVR